MALVWRCIGIRHRHNYQQRRHRCKGRKPLFAVDDPMIAVLHRARGEDFRVRAALRFGHRETRDDPVVQQRLQIALLELVSAVVGQDFAIAGIRSLGSEYDRRTFRPPENLVEQGQFHLAVSGSAQMRTQMSSPQPTPLDDLLQRRNQRPPHRVVEIVRLLDDQIDWLTLGADEFVDPGELCGPLRGGREIPGHRLSFRYVLVDDHVCLRAAASSVAWLSTWLRFSSSRADSSPAASVLTCMARLVSCTPSGASSAIPEAISTARSTSKAGSTSSLTSPRRSASSAETIRPVSIQSAATLAPTMRGRK